MSHSKPREKLGTGSLKSEYQTLSAIYQREEASINSSSMMAAGMGMTFLLKKQR
jgi:hypothetical protein